MVAAHPREEANRLARERVRADYPCAPCAVLDPRLGLAEITDLELPRLDFSGDF